MFFLHTLTRIITLHPSFFGPNMSQYLQSKLTHDVEGTCTGRYYIIVVLDIQETSSGRIIPGSGVSEFTLTYRAVVWRPFKGETVDAIVSSVNKVGFFADVGPLSVFVSANMIPPDVKFDGTVNPAVYTNNDDQIIKKGASVRIKLIGTRSDVGSMFAIGSVKEDYLGCL
jgi:DNA-directed RNA polymerase II subunit RPB7